MANASSHTTAPPKVKSFDLRPISNKSQWLWKAILTAPDLSCGFWSSRLTSSFAISKEQFGVLQLLSPLVTKRYIDKKELCKLLYRTLNRVYVIFKDWNLMQCEENIKEWPLTFRNRKASRLQKGIRGRSATSRRTTASYILVPNPG